MGLADICAGYSEGGKDTCQADSGGPLMALYDGEIAQVGITSWGIGCAQPSLYGVYTRLANFKGWIDGYVITPSISASGTYSPYISISSSGGGSIFYLLLPLFLIVSIRRFITKAKNKQGISE